MKKEEFKELGEITRGKVKGFIKGFFKVVLVVTIAVVGITVVLSILSVVLNKTNINDKIFGNLDKVDKNDKTVKYLYDKIDSLSMNGLYGEASDMSGSYYSVCYSNEGEFMTSDWNTFTYVKDKDGSEYSVGASEDGSLIEIDMSMCDMLSIVKMAMNEKATDMYLDSNSNSGKIVYYCLRENGFSILLNDYNKKENTDIEAEDIFEFCGLNEAFYDNKYDVMFVVQVLNDVTCIDVVYINEKGSQQLYSASYVGNVQWELGDGWYNGGDKSDIISDVIYNVANGIEKLYNNIVGDSNVSENSTVSGNGVE